MDVLFGIGSRGWRSWPGHRMAPDLKILLFHESRNRVQNQGDRRAGVKTFGTPIEHGKTHDVAICA